MPSRITADRESAAMSTRLVPHASAPPAQLSVSTWRRPAAVSNRNPVGYGGTLNQLVNSTAPDKGVGLTLNIPLRNREAQANQVRAELEYRQAQVRLHQLENQVRIEVRNAQFDVKQNRASVQAAQYAVNFARQTLDADQQKLKVGLTTTTAILQDASILTTSESNLVSAKAAYEKSRIELDRATGLLLDHSGIDVADATRGQVTHLPRVPYVVPRQDAPRERSRRSLLEDNSDVMAGQPILRGRQLENADRVYFRTLSV